MDKKKVARVLEEMATLLTLLGANAFKSRAFQNGARTIETLEEDLETIVAEGRLGELRGVGKGIAAVVDELVRTGSCADHDALREDVPAGVLELLRVPGLGPGKVRRLWRDQDITTVDQLEAAAREGKLRALDGFGAKTEANLIAGIERRKRNAGRWHASAARRAAAPFLTLLAEHDDVQRAEVCGSLRRWAETVHDVDLLAAVEEEHRDAVMDAFTGHADVETVLAHGRTKSSVLTADGIQVDLRAVGDAEFPFALHHFTGSKDHNTALRARAKADGLRVSEWGIFRGRKALAATDEAEVFGLLDLPWIPPELRENLGEIEAAEAGELPDLLTAEDIRGVLHAHSTWSDGRDSIEKMLAEAQRRGWKYLGLSDHSQAAVYANGLTPERAAEQRVEVERIRKTLKGFTLLHGIEVDILEDGSLDYPDDVLEPFDFVIASLHGALSQPRARATARVLTALRHPAVSILGHPTGRVLLSRDGADLDLDVVLPEAARLGVALEINANPRRLDLEWRYHRQAAAAGVVFSIGPDAHDTEAYDHLRYGIGAARKGWLSPEQVLNCRTVRQVKSFFARRRKGWTPQPGVRSRYDEKGNPL